MNKILLIGNGFDLAHGLKTKYDHFLSVLKNWNKIFSEYTKLKNMQEGVLCCFEGLEVDIKIIDEKNIVYLDSIIRNNSWVKYYTQCGAEMDGWIDFEKEIYPVITMFQKMVDGKVVPRSHSVPGFEKYCTDTGGDIFLSNDYRIGLFKVKKNKLLEDLREEFDSFIVALEIYLHEFVWKSRNIKVMKQIQDIKADFVISFNYISAESIYGIQESHTHHIHGTVREKSYVGDCNMILGIDENKYDNIDFTYYMKFFQRIQKRTGIEYKKFINRIHKGSYGRTEKEEYILYIYGHSLDKTDGDILKYLIADENSASQNRMKAKKVIIFYYNQRDYERKVLNLINIYNRAVVEYFIDSNKISFVRITDELA